MSIRASRAAFAAAMIGLGIISLVYGNSAELWQPIPKTLPARAAVTCLCGLIEIATGIGLLLRSTVTLACRVLLPFMLLWLCLLKLPGLFLAPQLIVSWETFGETAVLSAGAWCLFAAHAAREPGKLEFAVGESGVPAGAGCC